MADKKTFRASSRHLRFSAYWNPHSHARANQALAYRFSRNPANVAMALTYVSLARTCRGIVTLLLLVLHLVDIRYGVIAREDRCLSGKFCDDYRCYTTQARRWIWRLCFASANCDAVTKLFGTTAILRQKVDNLLRNFTNFR